MFAWERRGPKVFRSFPKDMFPKTKDLAANMGLYNGFLATGLLWSLFISDDTWRVHVSSYFLSCIAVAGGYAGVTVTKKIFFVQSVPGLVALLVVQMRL